MMKQGQSVMRVLIMGYECGQYTEVYVNEMMSESWSIGCDIILVMTTNDSGSEERIGNEEMIELAYLILLSSRLSYWFRLQVNM